MIHSGSRGFGYQVCDEYSKSMIGILSKYGISVPDRQLACAPVKSPEGQAYIGAMKCAANYAWNNRQCLMHLVREVFERVFNKSFKNLGMDLSWLPSQYCAAQLNLLLLSISLRIWENPGSAGQVRPA